MHSFLTFGNFSSLYGNYCSTTKTVLVVFFTWVLNNRKVGEFENSLDKNSLNLAKEQTEYPLYLDHSYGTSIYAKGDLE